MIPRQDVQKSTKRGTSFRKMSNNVKGNILQPWLDMEEK